jgi:PAS domain S-box-containing protein
MQSKSRGQPSEPLPGQSSQRLIRRQVRTAQSSRRQAVAGGTHDLLELRELYLRHGAVPNGVRPVVQESWERCRAYGVDPVQLRPQVADPAQLASARAASAGLLAEAAPWLEQFHAALRDTPHVIALSDADGYILRLLADPVNATASANRAANLFEGASWHERDIGCNGIGTCLAAGRPVVLIGPEHFQCAYLDWTCIGIPLRAERGEIVGALDFSVPNVQVRPETWGRVLSLAHAIETGLTGSPQPGPTGDSASDHSLSTMAGVMELLLSQLKLPPTHARFVEHARSAVALAMARHRERETERRRREAHLAFLAEVSEDFARLSSANEIMQALGDKIGAYLQVESCNFCAVDDARDEITVLYGWRKADEPGLLRKFCMSDYYSDEFKELSRRGGAIAIGDTQTDPRTGAQAYAALNIYSFLSVPFHKDRAWRNSLTVTGARRRHWHKDEIQLFEDLSNRVFPRIERARAEEALRVSEQKYRTLFESMDEGFCILQLIFDAHDNPLDYRYIDINPAFERQTGMAGARGRTVRELVPGIEEFWFGIYGNVALTGQPRRFVDHAESMGRWFDVFAFRIGEPHERKVAVLFNDITARMRAEQQLRDRERQQRLLAAVAELDARLSRSGELIAAIGECVATCLNVSRCGFSRVEVATGRITVLDDYHGTLPPLAGVYPLSEHARHYQEEALAGRMVCIEDTAMDARTAAVYESAFAPIQVRAQLTVPLLRGEEWVASFWVAHHAPRRWTEGEVKTIELIGERVWLTVERKRAEEALRAGEERLRLALRAGATGAWDWNMVRGEATVSDSYRELFGVPPDAPFTYESWLASVHPDDREACRAYGTTFFTSPEATEWNLEFRITTPHLGVRWHRAIGQLQRAAGGTPLRFTGVSIDITERKHAEQTLRESEERFRSILENMSEGLMLFDHNGDLVFQNPASLRLHGFAAPEHGKIARERLPGTWNIWDHTGRPLGFDEWPLSRVFRRERFQDQILRVVRVDTGQEFFGSYNGSPICDARGEVLLAFITIRDITEQVRTQEALQRSERGFRQLAESMPQLVWTSDSAGVVDYYNHRIQQYGAARKLADGSWEWRLMLHEDDRAATMEAWERATGLGASYQMQHRIQMADGTYRWHLSRAYPGRDGDGRIVKWFGTATDIDDQKRAQEILEQTVAERTARLRDTVAELEHFSYTITHDLRAPLRAMQAFGEILREEYRSRLDEMGADYLRRIIEAAGRMDSLITDSLNYAKAVQTELMLEPLDPGMLLRGIVESYPQFQPPRAEITLAPHFPRVLANAAGLTQCVSNLLGNAVKFVEPGKLPRVRIWAEERGDVVRLWCEDNGIGVPPDQQERIFVMFQRVSKSYEGTGVGLALVRKVAEKMRGRVGLESSPDGGTRFWLELGRVPLQE